MAQSNGVTAIRDVAITAYTSGFATVSETRPIRLEAGRNQVALPGLPSSIHSDTLRCRIAGEGGIRALGVDVPSFGLSANVLLAAAVGRAVWLAPLDRTLTDPMPGVLVAAPEEADEDRGYRERSQRPMAVVELADGTLHMAAPERISLQAWPERLPRQRQPSVRIASPGPYSGDMEVRYLTDGLSWSIAYNVELAPDGSTCRLSGVASISNETDTSFADATLHLVAGEVEAPENRGSRSPLHMRESIAYGPPSDGCEPTEVGDCYLYTVPEPMTLPAGATVQATLFGSDAVPVSRSYTVDPRGDLRRRWNADYRPGDGWDTVTTCPVRGYVAFRNAAPHLGLPLPGGQALVDAVSASGAATYVGVCPVEPKSAGEWLRLDLGGAFDLAATHRRTEFRRSGKQRTDERFVVTLRNSRPVAATVTIFERMCAGGGIEEPSHPCRSIDSSTVAFDVEVPAHGELDVTYRIVTVR
ncbi:MAG: hypothetical protein NT029_07000 [Armatimonadetes bacterium]|nr:hypothetical protein [Armatimonadota bacterium]